MLCETSSWKRLCLSSLSMPGWFQVLQNSSSLSSAQITRMRKRLLSENIDYFNTILCWFFVHSSSAIDGRLKTWSFLFISNFFFLIFNIYYTSLKQIAASKRWANSQAVFFSTSIVMWQVIQRVGSLGNVRHSTLTRKKKSHCCFHCFHITSKKAQIRKLNPLFAYPEW